MGRRPRSALTGAFLVCALAVGLGACSDEPERPAATVRTDVSTRPGPACHQIELRRRLASKPPILAYAIRNNDISNFTGDSAVECDERQIVYWGAPSPIQGDDRPMIYTRILFLPRAPTREQAAETAGGGDLKVKLGITDAVIYDRTGQAAARFVVGPMVVNVVAACVQRRDPDNLQPTACIKPKPTPAALRRRLLQAARTLERQLRNSLR